MSHNKMYREIKGYEDALYFTTDTIDALNDLFESIQYGKSVNEVLSEVSKVEKVIGEIRRIVEEGKGERVK